jgi:hypothetical protein
MTDQPDPADRDCWARLRFAIIGPLLAAPPAMGELQDALRALSRRTWKHLTTGNARALVLRGAAREPRSRRCPQDKGAKRCRPPQGVVTKTDRGHSCAVPRSSQLVGAAALRQSGCPPWQRGRSLLRHRAPLLRGTGIAQDTAAITQQSARTVHASRNEKLRGRALQRTLAS